MPDYADMDPAEKSLEFHVLLELHMRNGTGLKPRVRWTDRMLADDMGVTVRAVFNWRHKVNVMDLTDFDRLLVWFQLLPKDKESDQRTDIQKKYEEVFRSAWERVRKKPGGVSSSTSTSAKPFVFPVDLPADIDARRDAIRSAVKALLDAGFNSTGTGPMNALRDNWPEHALAKRSGDELKFEAARIFTQLAAGVDKCTQPGAAWTRRSVAADSDLRAQRHLGCHNLVKLLFAMVWSPQRWLRLRHVGRTQRLEQIRNPRLLQAGMDAAWGKDFVLYFDDPQLPAKTSGTTAGLPSPQSWFMACDGEIRLGVGVDYTAQILTRLGMVYGMSAPTKVAGHSATAYKARLGIFEEELGSQIRALSDRHQGRSAVLAAQLDRIDHPGLAELRDYAARLSCLPIAYDGKEGGEDGGFLRCPESYIRASIRQCLDAIDKIP